MASLTLRNVVARPLTNQEVDDNFTSLNSESANNISSIATLNNLVGDAELLLTTETDSIVLALNEVYRRATNQVEITAGGNITVSGNVSGNYFLGNGSLLSGISVDSTRIVNGTTTLTALTNGTIVANIAGTSIATFDKFASNLANIIVNGTLNSTTLKTSSLQDSTGRVLRILDESNVVIWGG
jgi:hypothetical protein